MVEVNEVRGGQTPWEANGYRDQQSYAKAMEIGAQARRLELQAARMIDDSARSEVRRQAEELRRQQLELRNPTIREQQEVNALRHEAQPERAAVEAEQAQYETQEDHPDVTEPTEIVEDPMVRLNKDKFFIQGAQNEAALTKYLDSLRLIEETGTLYTGAEGWRTVDQEMVDIVEKVMKNKDFDEVAAALYIGAKWRDDALNGYYDVIAREGNPTVVSMLQRKIDALENTEITLQRRAA